MNFKERNKTSDVERLEFAYWSFPGAWNLGLGASAVIAFLYKQM
jgi:hypothetical protein